LRAPDPSRRSACTRPRWWPRSSSARRAPGRASGGWPRRPAPPRPPPDEGVRLVDEEHDGLRRCLDLVQHRLDAVLELALDPGAGLQSPRSSERTAALRSAGGTAPSAMRSAKPSTTAVFPTPASPVRMGLFCRRRRRTSITWRISASRPRMGSMRPARASAVRSTVKRSRAGVAGSGPVRVVPGAGAAPLDSGRRAAPRDQPLRQPLARDRRERGDRFECDTAQSFVIEQGVEERAGARKRLAEGERGGEPGALQQVRHLRRQRGVRAFPRRSRSTAEFSSASTAAGSTPCSPSARCTSESGGPGWRRRGAPPRR
jgi:hypothetical protein